MAGLPPGCVVGTSFQPLFSVHSAALAGFEALARPVSPAGEAVGPAVFLASRLEADIPRVDRDWRRAHLARFASLDEGRGALHLNMHPRALAADAAAELREEIALHGLSPSRVCIEILAAEAADEGLLAQAAAACRAIGVRVALDGFGFARSNIDRVARIQPDLVKISCPALDVVAGRDDARRFLPSVARMLHDAGTEVAVSGIGEAPAALSAIEAGADLVQGAYFGIPRSGLTPDPMATELLCRLKRLRSACSADSIDGAQARPSRPLRG
jgi:EAL domain-containing protein (putative c-di-GMP-specific phosphodiesterase class I)